MFHMNLSNIHPMYNCLFFNCFDTPAQIDQNGLFCVCPMSRLCIDILYNSSLIKDKQGLKKPFMLTKRYRCIKAIFSLKVFR